jgi:hypothetical protein
VRPIVTASAASAAITPPPRPIATIPVAMMLAAGRPPGVLALSARATRLASAAPRARDAAALSLAAWHAPTTTARLEVVDFKPRPAHHAHRAVDPEALLEPYP